MTETVEDLSREVTKLEQALRLCQSELAALQADYEEACEERQKVRRRFSSERKRFVTLSRVLAETLAERHETDRRPVLGRISVSRQKGSDEQRQLRIIQSSSLFRAGWYLRRYPDVAEAKVDPAVHYLREGAAQGRDPGPRFSTKRYLQRHPELEAGGMNPLVHRLTRSASQEER